MFIEILVVLAVMVLIGVCIGVGLTLGAIAWSESFRSFIKGEIHAIEERENELEY